MDIVAPVRFISALHNALYSNEPAPAGPATERIVRRALADGWITPPEIENWLIATDGRLWQVTTQELLRVFEIPTQMVFERPTRGARDAEGLPRVSVVDFARLVVMLERAGLAVDAGLICGPLAPALGARRLLTAPELIVYWRAQGRCDDALTFHTERTTIGCAGPHWTTRAGYEIRGFYEHDPESDTGDEPDDVEMLVIEPPAGSSRRAAQVRSAASRRHLRKYLGEPGVGASPHRSVRSPAA